MRREFEMLTYLKGSVYSKILRVDGEFFYFTCFLLRCKKLYCMLYMKLHGIKEGV